MKNKLKAAELQHTVAYCGLVCGLCSVDGSCDCRRANHCGKRLSAEGCHQYRCCQRKGYNGCWECPEAPCGVDMLAPHKVKLRAFVRNIREEGVEVFCANLARNAGQGVVYHRNGVWGDYDLPREGDVLSLLQNGPVQEIE